MGGAKPNIIPLMFLLSAPGISAYAEGKSCSTWPG